jgi:NADH dehydrogenase FAD-containing subunit
MLSVIPVAGRLELPHASLQATLAALSPTHATLLPAGSTEPVKLPFKYLLYALGGALPAPISLLAGDGSKKESVDRLAVIRQKLDEVASARTADAGHGRVLVIGGGALGVQYSTDIKSLFPQVEVTLLHSRERMMTSFNAELHDQGPSSPLEGSHHSPMLIVCGH